MSGGQWMGRGIAVGVAVREVVTRGWDGNVRTRPVLVESEVPGGVEMRRGPTTADVGQGTLLVPGRLLGFFLV